MIDSVFIKSGKFGLNLEKMLSRILSRATLRAPVRSYTTSGYGSNRSWLQLWAKTGEEGAELWLLTVYMTVAGSMMLYQTCYATTFKKTEITTLPYSMAHT